MAKNFRVCAREVDNQSVALHLFGDFDATSACELIDVLDTVVKERDKVAIDTDGLTMVNAFGLDLFAPRMLRLIRSRADVAVTGRFSEAFLDA